MKKILSVLLTVLMVFSFCVPAFAAEEKLNFLSLGDSIAAGYGLINPNQQAYGAIVSNTNGYNFKNDAISGHTTQAMLNRISQKKVAQDIANADIICVSIGGNNFLLNNLPELINDALVNNDYSKFDAIADNYYVDLGTIMDTLKELNPDATILLQTLYNPMYADADLRTVYQAGADRLNAVMRQYLADNAGAYTLVEVGAAFGEDESLIYVDYIHPNSKGHVVIATEVLKTLNALGLGEATEPVYEEDEAQTLFDRLIEKLRSLMAQIKALFESIFGKK